MSVKKIVSGALGKTTSETPAPTPGSGDRAPAYLSFQELTPDELQDTVNRAYAGEKQAQFILGRLLFRGLGVEADPVESFKWLSLAAAQGDAPSEQLRGIVIQALSPEQITDGRRRITEFREQYGHPAPQPSPPKETVARHPSNAPTAVYTPKPVMPNVTIVFGVILLVMVGATVAWRVFVSRNSASPLVLRIDTGNRGVKETEPIPATAALRKTTVPPRAAAPAQNEPPPQPPPSDTPNITPEQFKELQGNAQKGDPDSQFKIGLVFAMGNGVAVDYAVAAQWYMLAAAKGHMLAQNNLAVLYVEGKGVPENLIEAYKWIHLSAENGNPSAARNREKLAVHMKAPELAEAVRRANALLRR